jgi:GNAT superfamily N-acetyltransferase
MFHCQNNVVLAVKQYAKEGTMLTPREFKRGEYLISTDTGKIDAEKVHGFLSQYSYWAPNRKLDVVRRSLENSLNFGVFHRDDLVGFARVVTDYATFAWLCDVIILPEHREHGLGKWLVECIINHPDIKPIRRLLLATRDAHGLYSKYGGFQPLANPERWMEKFNPNA